MQLAGFTGSTTRSHVNQLEVSESCSRILVPPIRTVFSLTAQSSLKLPSITIDSCDTVSLQYYVSAPQKFSLVHAVMFSEVRRIHYRHRSLARCYSFLHAALHIVTNVKAGADLFPERL